MAVLILPPPEAERIYQQKEFKKRREVFLASRLSIFPSARQLLHAATNDRISPTVPPAH